MPGESIKWPAPLYRQFLLLAWGAGIFAFRYPQQGLTAVAIIAMLCLWQVRARFRARYGLTKPGARELWAFALLAAAFASGWSYGTWREPQQSPVPQWVVEASEPSEDSTTYKKGLRLRGVVREVAGQTDNRLRLILDNLQPVGATAKSSASNTSSAIDKLPGGLVFTWYAPLPLRPVPGQELEATLRIRRVHSLMNFDLWEQESYWSDRGVWYRAWGRADSPDIKLLPASEPGKVLVTAQNPAQWPTLAPEQRPAQESATAQKSTQELAHDLTLEPEQELAQKQAQEAASEQYSLPVKMALWREDLRQRVLAALPEEESQPSKNQPDELAALTTLPRLPITATMKAGDKPPGARIRPGANFIPALLFGDKSLMSSAESELLARSTLAHSLALSGLHLSYAAAIGYALARLLFYIFPTLAAYLPRRRAEALAALLPALAYTWLGGAPPSLLRSLLMLVFWALLLFLKKPSVLLDGLLWAVGLILLLDPGSLFDLRLQMSALAIAAIAIAMPLLMAACRLVGNRLSGNFSAMRQVNRRVSVNNISGINSINGKHGSYPTVTDSHNLRCPHSQLGPQEAREPHKSGQQFRQRSGPFLRRTAVRLLQSAIIMLGTSFAVQVFLMPLLVRSFGIYGLAFPLNLLWLPVLGFLVMPASFLGLGAAALGLEGTAGALFHVAAWPCAKLLEILGALDAAALLPVALPSRPHWLFMVGWWLLLALLPLFISRFLNAMRSHQKVRLANKSAGSESATALKPSSKPAQNFCQKTSSEPAAKPSPAFGSKTLSLLTACKNRVSPNRLAAPLLFAGLGLLFCISPYFIRIYETGREAVRLRLLDVGQGQSILLEWTGGGRLLLDGGGGNSPRFDIGRSIVTATLLENRPPRLDYMLASHPDQDHTQGLLFALEHLDIGYFADNGTPAKRIAEDLKNGKGSFKNRSYTRLLELLEQRGLERNSLYAGDTLVLIPSDTAAITIRSENLTTPTESYPQHQSGSLPPNDSRRVSQLNKQNTHVQGATAANARSAAQTQSADSTAAPELVLEILHPPRDWATAQRSPRSTAIFSDNNASLVARLVWKGQPLALLCGDIEREAQRHMLASLPPQVLQAPVLVLPHHGSANASLEDFYRAVNPQLALVSCGYGNQWNFPTLAVVQRLQKLGIPLLNTADSGQILLEWTAESLAESLVENLAQNPAQSQAQPLTVNQNAPPAPSVTTSRTSRP